MTNEIYAAKLRTLTTWLMERKITFHQYHQAREKLKNKYLVADRPVTIEDIKNTFGDGGQS